MNDNSALGDTERLNKKLEVFCYITLSYVSTS